MHCIHKMHCTAEEEKCSLMGSCIVKALKRGPELKFYKD